MLQTPTETLPDAKDLPRLPLVAMEHYMLADDLPDYPMTFFLRLILEGQLRRREFERALARTLAKHPLLSATVEPLRGRWRNWVWGEAPPAAIYWNDGGEPEQRYLDLTQESGLRIKVDIAGDTT
ncbi:MAG: hypothetical protein K8T25_11665, partial [Planctomycetia bacterium]|nr:hypothetical protein [Planctomycetia bacterium]